MVAKKKKAIAKKPIPKGEKELVLKDKKTKETPVDKLENEKQLLYERLVPIREQVFALSNVRKERDDLNFKVKKLSDEVRKIKIERDEFNKKVQEEKKLRDEINKQTSGMRKNFSKTFGDQPNRRGVPELQQLRKKVKDMRWEIETRGFNFAEEKKRSAALKILEKQLKKLETYDNARQDVVVKDKDARSHHSLVIEYSKKSEEVHESLILLYEQLKAAREKADAKHNAVVDVIDKIKKMESEHTDDIKRLNEIKDEIKETREEWEDQKLEESQKTAKERATEAFAEFEKGGRVDLRDLQLKFLGDERKRKK